MRAARAFALLALVFVVSGSTCSRSEFASPTYELGEPGVLIIRNPSTHGMAIGGCNPSFYQERLPGRWVPDPLARPACVFFIREGEPHILPATGFIPPGGSIEVSFPTGWLSQVPGIMRVLHRVSLGCRAAPQFPANVACSAVEQLVTEPLVVFEPGTTDGVGPRPPNLF